MGVFKCLLLFLIVFCIQGSHSKPPYDEQAEASSLGSTLWGWLSYLNPWGSSADTSAPPKLEQGINSTQTKVKSVTNARQLTAATIPVNPTVQEPTLDKSLERQVTTPIISVQISTNTESTAKHFLEPKASITVKTSSENNPFTVKYSWTPLESTTSSEFVLDNQATTEGTTSDQHLELDALDQESPTTKHPATDDLSDPTASTISITSDLDNPTTKEEPEMEQPLEPESSKEETTTELLEATPTEEPVTEQPLELEVTTMSIAPDGDNYITVEESLESEAAALISQTVPDCQLEPELSTPSIMMVLDFRTSTEEIAMEQPLGPELSTTASALNDPTTDVPMINNQLEPEMTTTLIATDQNDTKMTQKIATIHSTKFELTTAEEQKLKVVVPTEPVSTVTISTDIKGAVFSGFGADEPSITTEPVMDPYTRLHEVIFKPIEEVSTLSDPEIYSSINLHTVMIKPVEIVSIFTEPPYPSANELPEKVDEESTQTIEALLTEFGRDTYTQVTVMVPETNEESSELVRDLYLTVASEVSGRDTDSTERSEGSILIEAATSPYLGVGIVVSERNKEATEEGEAILSAPATNSYTTVIEEASVSTVTVPNQFLEVEETISTGVKASMEGNEMLRVINEAIFTEKYEVIDVPRVSRSHSAGFQLSYDYLYFMTLFSAIYCLNAYVLI